MRDPATSSVGGLGFDFIADHRPSWEVEDVALFREAARRFLEANFTPHVERWTSEGRVEKSAWAAAGEAGFLCPSVPEEYGGGGGTIAHHFAWLEELERTTLGAAFGDAVHSGICAHYILEFGTEDQKRKWLPKLAKGETICAIGMTEPGTGSDLQGVKTRAVRDGDDYVINGQKTFITNGQNAGLIILVTKTDPEARAKGISLILVEMDQPGVSRGRNLEKLGMHAADTSELFFEDVRTPADSVLGGEESQGFYQLMNQLPQERLLIAVGAVAAMETGLAMTLDYVKQRHAFGQAIFDFQNTKHRLAEAVTEARIGRVFVDDCVEKLLAGTLDGKLASMAKYWASDKQNEVLDLCVQLHGGYGYMAEYPIGRMWSDARVQKIYGGTNEIMKELIARSL
jgi:acyl-CoA dehydrogenase